MLWIFSFKYWVVSVEMPKAINMMTKRSQSRSSSKSRAQSVVTDDEILMENAEKSYWWIKWIGILVNLGFTTWYCIEYGKLCMHTDKSNNIVVISKICLDTVAMISGLVLGDALRRIWMSYKHQTGLL